MRLGAYVLPGDPVWLRSTLRRYYDHLDSVVVPVPEDGIGWAGRPIPVDQCLAAIREVDTRGVVTTVAGSWTDKRAPLSADTAQRQAALDALGDTVDWVLQIDNDELVPDVEALLAGVRSADEGGFDSLEWPMRVLFRHLGGDRFLAVTHPQHGPVHEYPGPVAVRTGHRLVHCRQLDPAAPVLRLAVVGDTHSLQLTRSTPGVETRHVLAPEQAILHDSWGRSAREVWRKTRTWGHAAGARGVLYFATVWLPAPVIGQRQRNLHPFSDGLWPALEEIRVPRDLLDPADRSLRRSVWRSPADR